MTRELRVLMVEDSPYDAEMAIEFLRQGGMNPVVQRVESEEAMKDALNSGIHWDLILSDYSLPQFSGPEALEVLKQSSQDIPFIILSGTVGEEVAVASLKAGADDFLVKGQFNRLLPAIERELAEAKSRQSARQLEKKFLATFEQAAVGIAHVGRNGELLLLNHKFCQILGYELEELQHLNFQSITHPEDLPHDMSFFQRLIAGEIENYSLEKRYIRKDHSPVWVTLTVSLAKDENSQFDFAIGVIEDISRRKQAEEELQKYALLLERSNKELDEFATIASHDLQEPLRKVQIFSGLLAEMVPPEGQDCINRLQKSVGRMQTLISDLLALSRVHRRGLPFRRVSLNETLQNVLEDMQISIQETGAEIMVEPLADIYGDEAQIYQLFQNLLANALKYRRPGTSPVIKIYGQPVNQGERFQVVIQDQGIGIAREFYDRIFEPFQRLHAQSEYPGSGIGLTICKKIIERHNGTLTLDSEPGAGSRFMFSLPLVPTTAEPQDSASTQQLV